MIQGIDVSHYQGDIDWSKTGKSFAICKATQGLTLVDPTFSHNVYEAQCAGLEVGAYHYFNPKLKARDQADFFVSKLKHGMFLALDAEGEGWDAKTAADDIGVFMTFVKISYGKYPLLYFNDSFYQQFLRTFPIKQYNWWIASYGAKLPAVWSSAKFWQYTEKGTCPGVKGFVDLDVFNGTIEDLGTL
jgi:lysozyme